MEEDSNSNSLLKGREESTNTSTVGVKVLEEDSEVRGYLLGCGNSWESHRNICDVSCYSNLFVKGRHPIKIDPYIKVEEEGMCSNIEKMCSTSMEELNKDYHLESHMRLHSGEKT